MARCASYLGKRTMDLVLSLILLVVVSPLLIAAVLAIWAESGRPVLFRQTRVGRFQRPFHILKLRTMARDHTDVGQTYGSSPGVTRVGRLLRATKLDELPQLVNVVRGDMSLVGPRPCLVETALEMDERQRRRFEVRPGLTGLAQVSGNIRLSWSERCEHDIRYVEATSFVQDVSILFRTVAVVALGRS